MAPPAGALWPHFHQSDTKPNGTHYRATHWRCIDAKRPKNEPIDEHRVAPVIGATCWHPPLLPHLALWERLDSAPDTAPLADDAWRHFEPFLAARGYTLCWRYFSRARPATPFHPHAGRLPPPRDLFRPCAGEAFVHLLGMPDEPAQRAGGIHETTGWMTQAGCVKMAYDTQDRVCAIKALHTKRARAELAILAFLNAPANHAIPVLDALVAGEWTSTTTSRASRSCIAWEVDDYFTRFAFLHAHGIFHRDISAGNTLLNVHAGARGVYTPFTRRGAALAFIDFGCAVRVTDADAGADAGADEAWGTGAWGTLEHAAPEVRAARAPYRLGPADVHALGSVFAHALAWERIHCSTLGNPDGRPLAAHQVLDARAPGYAALLARMAHVDPARRPDAAAALAECRALQAALDPRVRWAPEEGYAALPRVRELGFREGDGDGDGDGDEGDTDSDTDTE
ncbi:hypothetical protein GGX14DRAFT_594313 [Mycena pura]|uniref:Protein kinase domain-containing protein n=1 Tax=Mycena pura TaxID=153505 RepID=A0AAD6USJ7_9AGAR|nr:hypothetical protein GGX14DRAFT_594313 [Mycena pura]